MLILLALLACAPDPSKSDPGETADTDPTGDTGGDTWTDTGGDSGDDTGGDTGTDTGGDSGDDTAGDSGDDTAGDTGGDSGDDTGDDPPPRVEQSLADARATIRSTPDTSVGVCSAALADVDGNGSVDLVAGDITSRATASESGNAAVYLSTPAGDTDFSTADRLLAHPTRTSGFGSVLAAVGDLDADGFVDLAVGAYTDGANGHEAGAVYLFAGPLTAGEPRYTDDAVAARLGESADDQSPDGLFPLGDVNGDGHDDLAVGTPLAAAGDRSGTTYLLYGPVTGEASLGDADARVRGLERGDAAGAAVAALGDADGDGVDDFAIGAPYASTHADLAGSIYVYTHAPSGGGRVSEADAEWTHPTAYAYSGGSLLAPGDLDGDGHADLVSTAHRGDGDASVVSVIHGPLAAGGSVADAAATLTTGVDDDRFGWVLADGGDADGDGAWDLWTSVTDLDRAGTAWLVRGPFEGAVHAPDRLLWTITGAPDDDLGRELLITGDLDGDGVPDPAVGASGVHAATPFRLYLFLSTER